MAVKIVTGRRSIVSITRFIVEPLCWMEAGTWERSETDVRLRAEPCRPAGRALS
jgi:hypothetical protein